MSYNNIAIVEPSVIVLEGLSAILCNRQNASVINQFQSFDQFELSMSKKRYDCVLLNPLEIQNRLKDFNQLKKSFPNTVWVGIIYSLYDKSTLNCFDDTLTITDTPMEILEKLSKQIHDDKQKSSEQEKLSDREIDVLIQLVNGLSNKEIADKLNISIHTVISHRKNISLKTGIKSQSGLTIYAISNKIISLETM